jgi:hypothetical protein
MVRDVKPARWIVIAFALTAALSVLAMGALGAGLYMAVAPLLPGAPSSIDALSGDWVWPAMIVTGLAWSPAWLLVGVADRSLRGRAVGLPLRIAAGVLVLWLAAWLVWWIALAGRHAP